MIRENRFFGLFFRGFAMGFAEVVPGISGGTIAFITGIYDELLRTLSGLLRFSWRGGFLSVWTAHNLRFLLTVFLGMAVGVLVFARGINFFLSEYPTILWGFFFGLILFTLPQFKGMISNRSLLLFSPIGLALALFGSQFGITIPEQTADLWLYFFGGMLAVCAWLLPAVSGALLLLMIGIYDDVLTAVVDFEWSILGVLVSGCFVGILLFSTILNWMMIRYRDPMVAFLLGLVIGSLPRLWPWRVEELLVTPQSYQYAGYNPMIAETLLAVALGATFLWGINRCK
ncbi:MAG: DUF368 domain-containing protein [Gammaproteobacteria bacterium]|nr:DUF368 domain-containing protein [Gammaproteobacteria bacterium]